MKLSSPADLDALDFEKGGGLVTVVAQDALDGTVRMVGWANREALEATLAERELVFWSRSRRALWKKGETSGHGLPLVDLVADCDRDTVLARFLPTGPTCHTGRTSCFEAAPFLAELDALLASRRGGDPEKSYTARLLAEPNLRVKKLGEETAELVAALTANDPRQVCEEAGDVLYHLLVACRGAGVSLDDLLSALAARRR